MHIARVNNIYLAQRRLFIYLFKSEIYLVH